MKEENITLNLNPDGSIPYASELLHEIPSHAIINKCLTGLGITYLELHSERDSIVVEPNVPVIVSKCASPTHTGDNLFGVYAKVTVDNIVNYVKTSQKKGQKLKIITTPESLHKVIEALHLCRLSPEKDFFILLDEAAKYVTENDFRKGVLQPFDLFWRAERKAIVSATVLEMRDPRFEIQRFTVYNICPEFNYKRPLKLITTNSPSNMLATYFADHKDDPTPIFIFLNSTDTVRSIIRQYDLQEQAAVFCSEDSVEKLTTPAAGTITIEHAYKDWDPANMRHYNFMTSRFYAAFDVLLDFDPHVLLYSDVWSVDHTMFHPYSDTVQIVGRFRRGVKSITHITSTKTDMTYKTQEQIDRYIDTNRMMYETLQTLRDTEADPEVRGIIEENLNILKYNEFLNSDGSFNYFAVDNFNEDEITKMLYSDRMKLDAAYCMSRYFEVEHVALDFPISDVERMKIDRVRENQRELWSELTDLLDSCQQGSTMDQEFIALVNQYEPEFFDIYNTLGSKRLRELKFSARRIRQEFRVARNTSKSTAATVAMMVYDAFQERRMFTRAQIKEELQRIYDLNGIKAKAKATDAYRYYEEVRTVRRRNPDGRRPEFWELSRFKFRKECDLDY